MINPKFEWLTITSKKYLRLTFKGRFSKQDIMPAIDEYSRHFRNYDQNKIDMIWDCIAMKSYDSIARSLWQETMLQYKQRTGTIWLITTSKLIKTGAKIISSITSFTIKQVSSWEELYEKLQ